MDEIVHNADDSDTDPERIDSDTARLDHDAGCCGFVLVHPDARDRLRCHVESCSERAVATVLEPRGWPRGTRRHYCKHHIERASDAEAIVGWRAVLESRAGRRVVV